MKLKKSLRITLRYYLEHSKVYLELPGGVVFMATSSHAAA
jgi:hypothetical protein